MYLYFRIQASLASLFQRERQRFIVISNQQSPGCIVASIQKRSIGRLSRENGKPHAHCPVIEMSAKSASTVRQRFIVISIQQSTGCIVASIQRRSIGRLSTEIVKPHPHCPIIDMSVNGASTISGLTSWTITWLCNGFSHNNNIGGCYGQKCCRRYRYYLLKTSVNAASTIFGIASLKIQKVSLHPGFIIELSPAFLGKRWL